MKAVVFIQTLVSLLSYLFVSVAAQKIVFQNPPSGPRLTLLLNENFTVEWTTDYPFVALWVFCDSFGNGPNGANLLHGNYSESKFTWPVVQVQACKLENLFHFEVREAGKGGGTNSEGFYVVSYESELPTTSTTSTTSSSASTSTTKTGGQPTSPSSTTTGVAAGTGAPASGNSDEEPTASAASPNNNNGGLGIGLGVGLGVGLPLSAAVFGIIWYLRKKTARRSPMGGHFTGSDAPLWLDQTKDGQNKGAMQQYAADDGTNYELEGNVGSRGRFELEGNK